MLERLLPLALACGCADLRVAPVTRVEYGRNTWDPNSTTSLTVESAQAQAGAVLHVGERLAIGLLAGPAAAWDDAQPHVYAGVNLNPRVFYFFDKRTFVHLEVDVSLYDGSANTYVLFAVEKEW